MSIRITPAIRQAMLDQALDNYPTEACGLIVGRRELERSEGSYYRSCQNNIEHNRRRRFLINPLDYLETEDRADAEKLSIVSIVHTHPDHPDEPSEFDRQHAWPGISYIIIAVHEGRIKGYRSWRLRDDRSGFDVEAIDE
jgi:proteasome lid subunit RPN8/RPN11